MGMGKYCGEYKKQKCQLNRGPATDIKEPECRDQSTE